MNKKETKAVKDTLEYVAISRSGLVVRSFGYNLERAKEYMSTLPNNTTIKLYCRSITHTEV